MIKNKWRITKSVSKGMFKAAPFSVLVTAGAWFLLALLPAMLVSVTAELLNSILLADLSGAKRGGLIFLLIYCLRYFLEFVYSITVNTGIYEKATMYFRIQLYEKMAKLPFVVYENAELLNVKDRAESAVSNEALSSLFSRFLQLVKAGVTLVSVSAVLLILDGWLAVLAFVSIVPYFIIRLIRGREFYRVHSFQAKKRRQMDYLWELFHKQSTVKEMRALGFGDYITDKWKAVREEVNEELWKLETKENLSLLLCDGIRIAGYGACIVLAFCLLHAGKISIGVFGACLTAFLELQATMKDFLMHLGNLPGLYALAEDYLRLMELEEEEIGQMKLTELKKGITLEDVSFSYPNTEHPAVEEVSLTIEKGMSVAVVGENGSGKTTLSRLILGMYAAQKGMAAYDGIPTFKLDTEVFRLSAAAQDFVQYQMTVGENIAVSRAGDTAELEDFIREFQFGDLVADIGGLDKRLGKEFGGQDLSKGQWQQLAIARGLYRMGNLLILDEPTAALDPIMENDILLRFLEKRKGQTTVIVSHRIGLCTKVDKIVVMDQGRIVECGNHGELMALGGKYHKMYTAQSKWYV